MRDHYDGDHGEIPEARDAVKAKSTQENTDENGYLPDGTKPSFVEDFDLAHDAANASDEDRTLAAAHREQGKTYEGKYSYVDRNRHEDVARAIGAAAELKEDLVVKQGSDTVDQENPELIDDQERKRYEKLIEIRAEASKLKTALSADVGELRREIVSVPPPNAYADYLTYPMPSKVVESPEKYDEELLGPFKNVTYAQRFGAVSDQFAAQRAGVEMTDGWPDKYSRYHSSLNNTVELDARNLFVNTSEDSSRVDFAVTNAEDSGLSDWTKDELGKLTYILSNHTNTNYARLESPPSIVLGQDKAGKLVAKVYYVVQVGDRSSRNLESVELHDIENLLQLADNRLKPVAAERADGQRIAGEIDLDVVKEESASKAEERNIQFIEDFKTNAPEYEEVPDDKLYELLKIAATSGDKHKYTIPEDMPKKERLILSAMRSRGKLNVITDSNGNIVHSNTIGRGTDTMNDTFEWWEISGKDRVTKTTYKGSPWSFAFGSVVEKETSVEMPQDEIVAMRKRILDLELRESAA